MIFWYSSFKLYSFLFKSRLYRNHSPHTDQIFNDFMFNVNNIFNQRIGDTSRLNHNNPYRNVQHIFLPSHNQRNDRRFNSRFNTSRDFTPDDYEVSFKRPLKGDQFKII